MENQVELENNNQPQPPTYTKGLFLNLQQAFGKENLPDEATFTKKITTDKVYRDGVHKNLIAAYGQDNVPDLSTFDSKVLGGEVKKKEPSAPIKKPSQVSAKSSQLDATKKAAPTTSELGVGEEAPIVPSWKMTGKQPLAVESTFLRPTTKIDIEKQQQIREIQNNALTNTAKNKLSAKGLQATPANISSEIKNIEKAAKDGEVSLVRQGNQYYYGRTPKWHEEFAKQFVNTIGKFTDNIDILVADSKNDPALMAKTLDDIKARKDVESRMTFNVFDMMKAAIDPSTSVAENAMKMFNAEKDKTPLAKPSLAGDIAGFVGGIAPKAMASSFGLVPTAVQAVMTSSQDKIEQLYDKYQQDFLASDPTASAEYQQTGVIPQKIKEAAATKAIKNADIQATPTALLDAILFSGTGAKATPQAKNLGEALARGFKHANIMGAKGTAAELATIGIEQAQGDKPEDIVRRLADTYGNWVAIDASFRGLEVLKSLPKYLSSAIKDFATSKEAKPIIDEYLNKLPNGKEIKAELNKWEEDKKPLEGIVPEDKMGAVNGLNQKIKGLKEKLNQVPESLKEDIKVQIDNTNKQIKDIVSSDKPAIEFEKDDLTGETLGEKPIEITPEVKPIPIESRRQEQYNVLADLAKKNPEFKFTETFEDFNKKIDSDPNYLSKIYDESAPYVKTGELVEIGGTKEAFINYLTEKPTEVTTTPVTTTEVKTTEVVPTPSVEATTEAIQPEVKITIDSESLKKNTQPEVDRVKNLPLENEDGATFNLNGTKHEGGLVVPVESLNTTRAELTPELINDFVEKNKDKISGDNFKVGIYKFPNSEKVSIDLNIVVDPKFKDAALEFGKLAGQESLFDLDSFQNVKTGATGENPKSFTPKEFFDIAKSLAKGEVPEMLKAPEVKAEIKSEPKTVADTVADDLFTHLGIEPEVKEAEKLNWTKQQEGVKETKISARNPITTEAAKDLKEGKITSEEYRAIVSDNSPVTPVTKFFDPATAEQVENSVDANKKQNANKPIDENKKVALRIDIPAFRNNNIWVISVHDGLKKTGEILSYKNAARITDVVFGTQSPKASLEIAAGGQKNATVGRIFGEWKNFEGKTEEQKGENAKKLVEEIANDPSWVQVGMNPFRHSYFYDRSSDLGRPVLSAKEVVQIGGLVYAKDVVYGNWNSEAFKVKGMLDKAGKPVYFQLEKSNKQEPKEPIKPSKKASAKEKEKYEKDLEKYKKEKALYDQDLEAISQANQDVKDIFDRAEIENNQASNEPITLTETEDKDIPTQKIEVSSEDKRPEASVMSKMMIKMGDWIQGAKVALGMSDTLRTGEREVVELDENGQKITKTIRDEGGIGFPFKSLMDLINGKIEAGKKAMGWAAVGEGAGTAMINAAKKSKKISGKELKEHYFKTLDLTPEQKQRIEDAIPDNKEYGLVTIYKMGEDGIKSNEAFSKEAFRLMDVKLTPEEKAKVFEIAANRLDKIEWGKDGVKEKYIDKLKNAKTFEELEFIINGEGSDMSLGTKAEIMQKIFLGTEKTTSTEKVNPLSTILKDKGITIESISKTLEEPIMTGIDAGQPMILLAIDPESKVVEDKQRHANYSYGVEGFPIGLFKETSQMHHLSPEMMDTFIKTATVSVDENVSVKGSKEKARISISHDRNGNYIAEIGKGATKVQFTDKKGVFTKTDGKFYDSKGKPIKETAKPLILDSKEALSKELQKQGYTVSEASKKEYTQQISGSNITNLMQKAKAGIINFFKNPEITAQQKLVKYINKSFPNIEIVLDAKEYKRIEQDFKNKKLLNVNQETFGVVDGDTGKIFLNPTLLNNNTPVHELGHVWNAYAKEYKPEIYNKGIELITNTENSKYFDSVLNNNKYQKLIKDLFGDDALIKDKETGTYKINESHKDFKEIKEYISDEALSKAIGDKGELFVNEAQKRDFKQWLTKLYNAVKQIVGFESMSADQFQNLNLKSFVDAAIKDILGGKKISEFTSKDLAELTKTKPKFELGESEGQDAKIKDFIEMQRKKGISNEDIKAGLEKAADRIGLDKNKIDELLTTKKEEYAVQEPSPEGVLQPTQEGVGKERGERAGMEQAEQGAIPPKEGKPSEAEVGGAEEKIGITKKDLKQLEQDYEIDLSQRREKITDVEMQGMAKNLIDSGYDVAKLVEKSLKEEKYVPTDLELNILAEQAADMKAKIDANSSNADIAKYRDILSAINRGTSEAGRALRMAQVKKDVVDSIADVMTDMMDDYKVDELTKEQRVEAEQRFKVIEDSLNKYKETLDKVNAELEKLKAEKALQDLAQQNKRDTPAKRAKTNEDYNNERKVIIASIKEKWNKASKGGAITAVPLPFSQQLAAIAPDVAKLIGSYLEQGAAKTLDEVRSLLKKDIEDIGIKVTDEEVSRLIAGEGATKKESKNELARQRYEIKEEQKLLLELENLEQFGKPKTRKEEIQKNQKLAELRKKIKDLTGEDLDDKFIKTANQRIKANETKLNKIQDKIKTGDFAKEPKPQSVLDSELLQEKNKELYNAYLKSVIDKDEAMFNYEKARVNDKIKNESKLNKIGRYADIALNTSKGTVAMFDQSYFLVQMLPFTFSHPSQAVKFAKEALLKDFISADRFKRTMAILHENPLYDLIEKTGLAVFEPRSYKSELRTELHGGEKNLWNKEFEFRGKKYSVGQAFERSTTSFMNNARISLFMNGVEKLYEAGKTFENSPEEFKSLARAINELTGQGKVQEHIQMASPVVNKIIWSPKMFASTLNILGLGDVIRPIETSKAIGRGLGFKIKETDATKGFYSSLTPEQRKFALKELSRFVGMGATIMIIAKLSGADDVDVDPRSPGFGTITSGNKTYNVFGRFASAVRTIVQVGGGVRMLGGQKDVLGDKFGDKTAGDVLYSSFGRGKMTPAAGLTSDLILNNRKNYYTKEEIDLTSAAKSLAIPLAAQDMKKDFSRDDVLTAAGTTIAKLYGANISDKRDFEAKMKSKSKRGTKIEGEKRGTKVVGQKRGSK